MQPHARCLDVTRLISRQGRGPLTGVDRVERAYLKFFLGHDAPFFALVRTGLGYLLLDRSGAAHILDCIDGKNGWGRLDLIGRLARKAHVMKRRAEADLRRICIARCRVAGLGKMLARSVPPGTTYLNVGHSNLSPETFLGCNRIENGRTTVLIHDLIPLDYPAFQRPGTVERFEAKMRLVAEHATHVICISKATQERVMHWFAKWGREVTTSVAHLGVDMPTPDHSYELPPAPYFVAVGTIEPRKNHALLLDLWQDLRQEEDTPRLVIAGARGWNNAAVFDRLDTTIPHVHEVSGLPDAALAALIQGSNGVLMPSHAEGFGLPPVEALLLGVPVICNDLPIFREVLGNNAIYAESADMYLWKQSVMRLARRIRAEKEAEKASASQDFKAPNWDDHFNHVLSVS